MSSDAKDTRIEIPAIPYEEIYNEIAQLIAIISNDGTVLDANDAIVHLSGVTKTELVGKPYWELGCWLHSEEMQNRILFAMEESAITQKNVRFEAKYKDYQNKINDVDLHIKAIMNKDETVHYYLASGYNVTELVLARKSLSERERQMHALFEYSKEGYFFNTLPEGMHLQGGISNELINDSISLQRIVRMNRAFKDIIGYELEETLSSDKVYRLLKIPGKTFRQYTSDLLTLGEINFEYEFIDNKGNTRILEVLMVAIVSENIFYGNFGVVRDLTTQRQYESELEFYANRDLLTGLNNRRTFFNKARNFFTENNRSGFVSMLDIDHFKKVNDTYGHDMGDIVLKQFAQVIQDHFKENVIPCRYGGEEFAVLFQGMRIEETYSICESFRLAIGNIIFETQDQICFKITVSIGLAEILKQDDAVDKTISRADKALYESKNNGRNQTTIFEWSK